MTPQQWISRIRLLIDDEDTSPRKAGVFWTDADIIRTLDTCQLSVFNVLAERGVRYILQGLQQTFVVALPSDIVVANLPNDYAFSIGGSINDRPAMLQIGGVGMAYENADHYGVLIQDNRVVFKGGANGTGRLFYYRRPTSFGINTTVDRTEFEHIVYQAIMFAACTQLETKEEANGLDPARGANSRFAKNFTDTMRIVLGEPVNMIQLFDPNTVA